MTSLDIARQKGKEPPGLSSQGPPPHNLGGLCPQNAVHREAFLGGSYGRVGVLTKLSMHMAVYAGDTVALSVSPCVVGPGVRPQSAGSG